MPEEELFVGLYVDTGEVEPTTCFFQLLLYVVVDLCHQECLILVICFAIVLVDFVVQLLAQILNSRNIVEKGGLFHGRNFAEVFALVTLEQGVALHNLEVEVGQGLRLGLVHHE